MALKIVEATQNIAGIAILEGVGMNEFLETRRENRRRKPFSHDIADAKHGSVSFGGVANRENIVKVAANIRFSHRGFVPSGDAQTWKSVLGKRSAERLLKEIGRASCRERVCSTV